MNVLEFDNPIGQKMKHPGTYNANPLSAAAGTAALEIVSTGEPCDNANRTAEKVRAGINKVFEEKGVDWVAYGDFSVVRIHPEYDGPRPEDDSFIPFDNNYLKLDREFDRDLQHAFRCAMLLGGVDWMGWAGTTTAVHTDDDVEKTVAAFSNAIDLLRADGMVS